MHSTVTGFVRFNTKKDFDSFIARFSKYIKDDHFVNESGNKITEHPNVFADKLFVEIPKYVYKDIAKLFDGGLISKIDKKSDIVWTSCDGVFIGGVISNGSKNVTQLANWAKSLPFDRPPADADPKNYLDWQIKVQAAFLGEYT